MPPAITDWATKAPTPHKTPASRTPPQAKAADVWVFMKEVLHPCACCKQDHRKKKAGRRVNSRPHAVQTERRGRWAQSGVKPDASQSDGGGRKLEVHRSHDSEDCRIRQAQRCAFATGA